MSDLHRIAPLALAGVMLASCTGEIMRSHINRVGTPGYFAYGASAGEMLAVVVGNPFPVSQGVVERAVTDALQGNHAGPRTVFTTTPGPQARTTHRIVVLFNPERSFNRYGMCDDPATLRPGPAAGERLEVLVGYCVEDTLYSDARVSIPAAQTPDDPRFGGMVASAMWQLVPHRDPFDTNDCRVTPCS